MKSVTILSITIVSVLQAAMLLGQEPSAVPGMDKQKHREMMPMHAKMMEKQKVQDAEIDKLLATMNSATGEQRIDAIVAVINKLVEQRKTMHADMAAHLDK